MNATEWEKLRKNITLLQREVEIELVLIPYLIEGQFQLHDAVIEISLHHGLRDFNQNNVLDIGCSREYEGLSNDKKAEHLLETLKGLPEDKNAYEHLLQGLRKSGFDDYCDIADKIDATVTVSDPSINAKVNPQHYSRKVRGVLNAKFANNEGHMTSLAQIRTTLNINNVFGRSPWSDEELTDFVCKLFAGVEVLKKQDILKTRTEISFKHLAKIGNEDPSEEYTADLDVNICSLNRPQLARFLRIAFEKAHMSTDSLSEMEKEDITGEILLEMSQHDLSEVMPSSTFGQRRMIMKIIEDSKIKTGAVKRVERFRNFDADVKPHDCYIFRNIVDTNIRTRGTKLSPVRNFHELPEHLTDNEVKAYIIIQCVIFASACINERQNGTIYFGICPNEAGGKKKGQIEGICLSLGDLGDHIMSLFFPSQEALVKNALRNAKYVPVFMDDKCTPFPSETRHVIEYDVVPASSMKEEEYIRMNAKDLPNPLENYQSVDPVFILSEHGEPKLLPPSEICSSIRLPASTIKQRGKDEFDKLHHHKGPDCLTRLRNHLTGGSHKMEDDIYKVLILSSVERSSLNKKSLNFIQNLNPEVVFDFDPNVDQGVFKALEDQEEILKVVTLDDFDERKRSKKDIKTLKTELTESSYLHWVFCNGFREVKQML